MLNQTFLSLSTFTHMYSLYSFEDNVSFNPCSYLKFILVSLLVNCFQFNSSFHACLYQICINLSAQSIVYSSLFEFLL